MNMEKKIYLIVATLLATVTLGLSACGKQEAPETPSSTLSGMQDELKRSTDSAAGSLSEAANTAGAMAKDAAAAVADNAEESAAAARDAVESKTKAATDAAKDTLQAAKDKFGNH